MPRYMEYLGHITEGELLRKTAQGKYSKKPEVAGHVMVMMELAWISPPDRFSLVRMIP